MRRAYIIIAVLACVMCGCRSTHNIAEHLECHEHEELASHESDKSERYLHIDTSIIEEMEEDITEIQFASTGDTAVQVAEVVLSDGKKVTGHIIGVRLTSRRNNTTDNGITDMSETDASEQDEIATRDEDKIEDVEVAQAKTQFKVFMAGAVIGAAVLLGLMSWIYVRRRK